MQLQPRDQQLWGNMMPLLSGAERFRPPRVREIADSLRVPEAEVRRLLKWLGRADLVREVAPDHFFLRQTVAEMVDIAAEIAATSAGGQFTAAQLKIFQEVITILVFVAFAWLYLGEAPRWNEAVAFAMVLGAVVFATLPR